MKISYIKSKRFLLLTSLIVLDGAFFFLTNPNNINSSLLIIGFLLLSLTFFGIFELFLHFLGVGGFKVKHKRRLSVFLAVIFGFLLALQSIGQLTLRDVLVLLPLSGLLYLYLTYIKPRSSN